MFLFTSVFITAFYPARGAARARGKRKRDTPVRSFAPSRVVAEKEDTNQRLVPGMSQYSDEVEIGVFDGADQDSAAISQRCEFFELSP